MARTRRNWRKNQSKLFGVPALTGIKTDISRALRVGENQIAKGNEFAQSVGCGSPFRSDGNFEADSNTKKRYLRELNKRRVDAGEPRVVNFDGGFGDVT